MNSKFPLGQVVYTLGAEQALKTSGQDPLFFLRRHAQGDWGDMSDNDKAMNDEYLTDEGRLHSSYKTLNSDTIWVITESDRSVTTLLMPEEY